MKKARAVLSGILVWILGVSVFTTSYFLPFMKDLDLQSNIALSLSLIPFAWLGAGFYYRKDRKTNGIKLGFIMVLSAIILDGLITVPFMIMPYGGTYSSFFTAASFWIIAFEYLMVINLYWRFKIKPTLIQP